MTQYITKTFVEMHERFTYTGYTHKHKKNGIDCRIIEKKGIEQKSPR